MFIWADSDIVYVSVDGNVIYQSKNYIRRINNLTG